MPTSLDKEVSEQFIRSICLSSPGTKHVLMILEPNWLISSLQGVLPDGREIAVKRLFFNNRHRAADFYNEINIISSVEHKNLVRLLGCSCSGPESLLVYEYLANKSLDRFIFGSLLHFHVFFVKLHFHV